MSRLIDGPLAEREAAFRDERGVGPRSFRASPAPRSRNDGVEGAPNGISVPRWSLSKPHLKGSRPWASLAVTRVGLDLAKRVFQVHAVDAKGEIVVARKLTRNQLIPFFAALPPCVVAMEACHKLISEKAHAPPEMRAWLDMVADTVAQTGFSDGLDVAALTKAYIAHNESVQAAIPAHQLLVS